MHTRNTYAYTHTNTRKHTRTYIFHKKTIRKQKWSIKLKKFSMYSKTYLETFVKTFDAITPIYLMDQTWFCVYCWWQSLEGVISPNNWATIRRRKWSEPFSWKIWTYLFHTVNIISDDGLVIQGTMASLMDNIHQVSDDSLLHQSDCLGQ